MGLQGGALRCSIRHAIRRIMAFNPMALLQIKEKAEGFNSRHPKLAMFFKDAGSRIDTGAVLELSVTTPDGNKIRTNFRVCEEDKEFLAMLTSLAGQNKQ
ncbi:hypothetical protein [uncultured Eubacterium sp.]|nr:hypothetical protein [uncultured Eubacterium sp.]